MRSTSAIVLAATAAVFTLSVQAREAGELSLQVGAAHVAPDASSSELSLNGTAIAGSSANVQTDTQLGLTLRYMWTDSVGVELLASTPFSHDITADTGAAGLGRVDAGDASHLPPTVSVLWFPAAQDSALQPYFGLGLNYTKFFSEGVSTTLDGVFGPGGSLDLDDSFGLSVSAGLDYALSEKLSINAAIRYIDIGTTATFSFPANELIVDVDIDPIVYMVGLGYKF